eukprot:1186193-Lingulodinium_polyedra.AAC.1
MLKRAAAQHSLPNGAPARRFASAQKTAIQRLGRRAPCRARGRDNTAPAARPAMQPFWLAIGAPEGRHPNR